MKQNSTTTIINKTMDNMEICKNHCTENYVCYVLTSFDSSKSYVGSTNDIHRRIRQHNGEIKGGAKYTQMGRPWRIACIIEGFQTHQQALQFEWALKFQTRKLPKCKPKLSPIQKRGKSLIHLVGLERWTSCAEEAKNIKLLIHWYNQYMIPSVIVLPEYIDHKLYI